MIKLFPRKKIIDTNVYKSVEIYEYSFKRNRIIKDSILLVRRNLTKLLLEINGHIIERSNYQKENALLATLLKDRINHLKGEKKYDVQGNIIERNTYTRNKVLYYKTLYTYDSLTQLLTLEERFQYYPNKTPTFDQKIVYLYDGQFLVKEIVNFCDSDSKLTKLYNQKGQTIDYKSETFKNDTLTHCWGLRSLYRDDKLYKEEHYGSDRIGIITKYYYNHNDMPIIGFSYNPSNGKPTHLVHYYYSDKTVTDEINPNY
ncbi:hypothetical protein [Kordia sp.]|uniref:hypothetical protein n=1 Tax=Kordia sp. TaxID=1965332 RepID=UPI003B5BE393